MNKQNQKSKSQKIAIKCDSLNVDKIQELVVCTTSVPWMPADKIEIPFSAVYAVWRDRGVAVVDMARLNKSQLRAIRVEKLPDDEPDVISYKITVCEKGHRVELADDDYYCPVCRRDSDMGLRVKTIEVKIPSGDDDWRDAEVGPPVIDDETLCCTENNVAYFFERIVGAKADGVGKYNIAFHYNVIEFLHMWSKEERGKIRIERGLGVVRFSDYDTVPEFHDLAIYEQMIAGGVVAWRRIRDVSLDDVVAAAKNNSSCVASLVEMVPQWRDEICNAAWTSPHAYAWLYTLCRTCGPPPNWRELLDRLDYHGVKDLLQCGVDTPEVRERLRRLEEQERKKEEERRRKLEEERKKDEMRKIAKIEEIRMHFDNTIPVIIEEKDGVVYVRLEKRVDDATFRRYVQMCKKLGMRFDSRKKAWYLEIEPREYVDYDW